MKEEWRDIKGYEGLYQVSNLGRVKSLKKKTFAGINGGIYITRKERILNYSKDHKGYLRVNLCINKISKKYFVHRLVAGTFLDNPNNLPQVNHKDENKENNYVSNLEYCTQKYNVNYGSRTEKTRKKVICLETGIKYESITEAEKTLNIANQSIVACCKGKRKTAGGYSWKYIDMK